MENYSEEEILQQLLELEPSRLDDNAKKLFDTIMSVLDERDELREKVKLLNKMNEENYNKYCETLKKYNEVLKNIVNDCPGLIDFKDEIYQQVQNDFDNNYCEKNCEDKYTKCWDKFFTEVVKLKEKERENDI